jgi:hypothetical protein
MQAGYWVSYHLRPPAPPIVQPVIGHVVVCAARFAFVLAGSVYSLVFLEPTPGFSLPVGRYVLLIVGLFAVFCYTLELERFGQTLIGPGRKERSELDPADKRPRTDGSARSRS